MKINQLFLSIAIVIIMFGTISATSALGLWQTTSTKIPATYLSGDVSGQYNPADIRGSYTFGEISDLFEIPLMDLGNAFAIENESSYSAFQCKELESIYVPENADSKLVGTDSVGIFVALYKGLPIELNDSVYLPNTAEAVLLKAGKLTKDQQAFLASHLVDSKKVVANNPQVSSLSESSSESSGFIKGKTTFKEVLAIGIKKEAIEAVIKASIPDTSVVIKDFCLENSLEFTLVKTEIQSLIDKK
jgi:hypothetical protein